MTWNDVADWLNQRFAAVLSWLKREDTDIKRLADGYNYLLTQFQGVTSGVARIERDQQLFFNQLFAKVNKMASDLDAVTTELTSDTQAMTLAAAAIDALTAAVDAFKASGAGDAAAHLAATEAAAKAETARKALEAKLNPPTATSTTATTETPAPTPTT